MSADLTVPPLPCPFCGDDGDKGVQKVTQMMEGRPTFNRITCRSCGAMCPEPNWNRRPAPDSAALLRAVPPLPVVAWYGATVDDCITDAKKQRRETFIPWDAKPYDCALVRKADADAALASLQASIADKLADQRRRLGAEHDATLAELKRVRCAAAEGLASLQARAEAATKALDYIARRLQMDIDDGSRPDQWSMEDMVRKARAATSQEGK
jgi:hypothetical protein